MRAPSSELPSTRRREPTGGQGTKMDQGLALGTLGNINLTCLGALKSSYEKISLTRRNYMENEAKRTPGELFSNFAKARSRRDKCQQEGSNNNKVLKTGVDEDDEISYDHVKPSKTPTTAATAPTPSSTAGSPLAEPQRPKPMAPVPAVYPHHRPPQCVKASSGRWSVERKGHDAGHQNYSMQRNGQEFERFEFEHEVHENAQRHFNRAVLSDLEVRVRVITGASFGRKFPNRVRPSGDHHKRKPPSRTKAAGQDTGPHRRQIGDDLVKSTWLGLYFPIHTTPV
ncbi:hypothetical protein BDN72DRAFT_863694 [Pluteus cervinus]|uniref:Uncharacterized protein n=1 Tax=Pluteus cervinus TaxID=181527 RepID=A0ACD3A941_9AGAR|nr:hypothetical protein BDN72DRAFT_863694 [Pluteus cervinus]